MTGTDVIEIIQDVLLSVYPGDVRIAVVADQLNRLYDAMGTEDFPLMETVRVIWNTIPDGSKAAEAADSLKYILSNC